MSKRSRLLLEEASPGAVEASEESRKRFEAYITRWQDGVPTHACQRPSSLPGLSSISTVLDWQLALGGHPQTPLHSSTPAVSVAPPPPPSVYSAGSVVEVGVGTGIVYDDRMLQHVSTDPKDFERPTRLNRTVDHLSAVGLLDCCHVIPARAAKTKELRRVHTREHIDYVDQLDFFMSLKQEESCPVGQDLYACKYTALAARLAAGSVIEAAMAVVRKKVRNAFAIVRPPGHHAAPECASGFCFFNNVAIAARAVQEELCERTAAGGVAGSAPKVMILDWDVHHCDGTESAFYEDPSVLVVSIHQHENRRGHVLRKTPTVFVGESAEMSEGALAALLEPDHNPFSLMKPSLSPDESPQNIALPNEMPIATASLGEGTVGKRVRKAVDYEKLASEMELNDDAAAALLGLSDGSSYDSTSSPTSDSDSGDGSRVSPRMVKLKGDTEGMSFDRTDSESSGEEPFYPGTGHLGRVGGDITASAQGRNINIPWPAHGMGDLEYMQVMMEVVVPVGLEFQPDILFISCGFDSAAGDLLGSMNLSPSGYYMMTKVMCQRFSRVVVALEGGYNVSNVGRCSEAVLRALLEETPGTSETLPPTRMLWFQAAGVVKRVKQMHQCYWTSLGAPRRE